MEKWRAKLSKTQAKHLSFIPKSPFESDEHAPELQAFALHTEEILRDYYKQEPSSAHLYKEGFLRNSTDVAQILVQNKDVNKEELPLFQPLQEDIDEQEEGQVAN